MVVAIGTADRCGYVGTEYAPLGGRTRTYRLPGGTAYLHRTSYVPAYSNEFKDMGKGIRSSRPRRARPARWCHVEILPWL
jgi:hypothetical protein